MGLNKNDYEARRVATLNHIRLKWTDRSELDQKVEEHRKQLKAHIRPLVLRYTSAKSKFSALSEDERVEVYAQWAFQINNQSRDEIRGGRKWSDRSQRPEADTDDQKKSQSDLCKTPEKCDTILGSDDRATDKSFSPKDAEQSNNGLTKTEAQFSALSPQTPDPSPSKTGVTLSIKSTPITTVDWDNIEVVVDATVLGLDPAWLPMINLKPNTAEQCHWRDFELKSLLSNFESDTGKKIDMAVYEFIYDNFAFGRQGGYSIALKRFVALGERRGETFHLRVEAKAKTDRTGDDRGMMTPDRDIHGRRSREAKSGFTGSPGDYSDDGSDAPLSKKRK